MKRYSKKKGLSILILFVVILALCIYTVTAGFGDGKKGSARNIKLGLDLEGGVSITYVANEEHPSVEDMNDTIYKLQKRLETYSTEANVYQQGENRITVEIPGVTISAPLAVCILLRKQILPETRTGPSTAPPESMSLQKPLRTWKRMDPLSARAPM